MLGQKFLSKRALVASANAANKSHVLYTPQVRMFSAEPTDAEKKQG